MHRFVEEPNLPCERVMLAAISGAASKTSEALAELGVKCLPLPAAENLQPGVAQHADMLLHHLGGGMLVVHNCVRKNCGERLRTLGFSLLEMKKRPAPEYPRDVALNALRVGRRLFCRLDAVEPTIHEAALRDGVNVYACAQGYAKCAAAVVGREALITADPSIARAAAAAGLEVLVIRPGFILLRGYAFGFIGGCCGLVAPGALAFTGRVEAHPDFPRMQAFCRSHGVTPFSLHGGELEDIGGILPLMEQGRPRR